MKKIEKWVANDGKEFNKQIECEQHEIELNIVDSALAKFGKLELSSKFNAGYGYYQRSRESVKILRETALAIVGMYTNSPVIQEYKVFPTKHIAYASMLASNLGLGHLNEIFYRLQCIDSRYREWCQPYYVDHVLPCDAKNLNLAQQLN